ncbi:MAG: antitoxin Xre/MbcA/ParS toxin-binding domain-containing protein [Aquisalimonadaceae bacterium]
MENTAYDLPPVSYDSPDTRRDLARMIMRLFEHWRLDSRTRLELLGMSPNSRSKLSEFTAGKAGLPKGRDARDRVAYLLSIHKALRLLYPENPTLRYDWVNRRNRMLENMRPIDVMREQGLIGIARVARFLDYLRGQ